MKKVQLTGAALAVLLIVSACGKDSTPGAEKRTGETTNPVTTTPVTPTPPAPAAIRNLETAARLKDFLRKLDPNFTAEANCVQLVGESTVNFAGTPCPANGAALTRSDFSLQAVPVAAEQAVGQKGAEPKPHVQGQVPAPKAYVLWLRRAAQKGKQQQQIPAVELKVGEFVVEYETKVTGKPTQQQPEIPVGQKPGQQPQQPVGQKPTPKPEQPVGQKPGQQPEIPVGQKPTKPEQKPVQGGKPATTVVEHVVLTKLCSEEYANVCNVVLNNGKYETIQVLGQEQVTPSQKGKPTEKPVGQKPGQQPEVKPEQKPAQKPDLPVGQKPAQKPEVKPEQKPAQKPEVKPEQKPVQKPEVKPEQKPAQKPEVKPEQKPAPKPGQQP